MKKYVAIFALTICLCLMLTACDQGDKVSETAAVVDLVENPATDFQYEVSPSGEFIHINKYIGTSENVVIPAKINGLPVTRLQGIYNDDGVLTEGAFESTNVKTVVVPESITQIGTYAFKGCTDLEKITLPDTITKILYGAFWDCSSLLEIQLPKSLIEIAKKAFWNCTSLKTITVPANLDLFCVDSVVFYNVPALEKIVFEEGREEIRGYAFFDITSNVEIIIPKSVKKFSTFPFFIHGPAKIIFLGDCPKIVDEDFCGEPTIYYDTNTDGWEDCVWKSKYPLEPME